MHGTKKYLWWEILEVELIIIIIIIKLPLSFNWMA